MGIDLQDYYLSVEWDIMRVPAVRNEKFYSCCEEPYPDIIFNITLRRKTLFYTVNLIIPCVGISFLSVLVFYLPSDSGEKVSADGISDNGVTKKFCSVRPPGVTLHLYPSVSDRVLPPAGRNHSADLAHSAPLGQVPALHHGAGHAICRGHHRGAQRQLPVAGDAQNGALGQQGLYKDATKGEFLSKIPKISTFHKNVCKVVRTNCAR